MKNKLIIVAIALLSVQKVSSQTLSEIQMRNARATGYAIIAARNPGKSFSVFMIPWDGVNTLEYNVSNQINSGWHPQAVIKGNYFDQSFDGSNFSNYSSVLLSQEEFDQYKNSGTQWWIACSTLPSFSNNNISIAGNGNVGIGTNSPAVKLAVTPSTASGLNSGLTYITPVVNIAPAPAANHSVVLIESNGTGTSKTASLALRNNRSVNFAYDAPNYAGDLLGAISFEGFSTNTGVSRLGAWIRSDVEAVQANSLSSNFRFITTDPYTGILSDRMIITSSGNVGIGTNNPGLYKLAVNGSAIFTKVQVKASSTPWPDYVFHPNYKLRSLSSLKAYINEYKHLPDVPSTTEVEKGGLDIGSIQATLLQKIEELTLYMLNQDDEIKKLKKQIDAFSTPQK